MANAREQLRLAHERRTPWRMVLRELERHLAIELPIARAKHSPECTAAECLEEIQRPPRSDRSDRIYGTRRPRARRTADFRHDAELLNQGALVVCATRVEHRAPVHGRAVGNQIEERVAVGVTGHAASLRPAGSQRV